MIIGNNSNANNNFNNNQLKENNQFNRRMNQIQSNNEKTIYNNPFVEDLNSMQHSNPNDRITMRDKSIAMLQERLENGTISLDEFNKKVSRINNNK